MFSDSESVFEYVMRFVNVERGQATEFKLDRMAYLASRLGNPHLGRLTAHIAGSKGKGSVSAMSAAILASDGLRTGLYTSPHLMRWKERIALAQGPFPDSSIVKAAEELLPFIEGKAGSDFPGDELPTFFELTTLIAFLCFRNESCVAQVIETGLGGRLDSTNIVEPNVSVITPIELEHVQFLGDTIAKIAGEKAGIIKRGKPVCIAAQKPEAEAVFASKAGETESELFRVADEILIDSVKLSPEGSSCRFLPRAGARSAFALALPRQGIRAFSPMIGKIQASNMALACIAASIAKPDLPAKAYVDGLAQARLPARYEMVSFDPPIVLDGAHTPESVSLALDTTRTLFPQGFCLLFACAADKRHREMAAILAPHALEVVITKPGSFKASEPEAVMGSFEKARNLTQSTLEYESDPRKAFEIAARLAKKSGTALLVCGSFYLCAEVRAAMGSGTTKGA